MDRNLALCLREQGRDDISGLLNGVPDEQILDVDTLRFLLNVLIFPAQNE